MAFTDDAVKAKLSALNETQESIVSVAQWVMFHRRHAPKTAELWIQRLKDAGVGKRLNLIYLANEVVQQSKARRKDDFVNAFSPIVAEATAIAFKGAGPEVQTKLRRVVQVWRERQIFAQPIQEAIEARIDELDKHRSGKKGQLGGTLFASSGSNVPPELQPLIPFQTALSKAEASAMPLTKTANVEYDKLTDLNNPVPTPPVHAARLSALLKSLATAEGAVAEGIKAREGLISSLEQMLSSNRAALEAEQNQRYNLVTRRNAIEGKKREVEDSIMRGLSAETPNGNGAPNQTMTSTYGLVRDHSVSQEPERPNVEALTPPHESLTPTTTPPPTLSIYNVLANPASENVVSEQTPSRNEATPAGPISTAPPNSDVGADLLRSLNSRLPPRSSVHARPSSEDVDGLIASAKRRRTGQAEAKIDFEAAMGDGDGMDGLDDDVVGMLGRE